MKTIVKKTLWVQAAVVAGIIVGARQAAAGQSFSNIAENIITSIEALPGLLSGLSYMFGLLLGVLGIVKIKDHVENPSQTPLKDGAIRLAAGGALFALPIVSEAMLNTIGISTNAAATAELNPVELGLQ